MTMRGCDARTLSTETQPSAPVRNITTSTSNSQPSHAASAAAQNTENKNQQSIYLSTNASPELKITVACEFELQIISLGHSLKKKRERQQRFFDPRSARTV
ncbi:hypothetical protein TNCT_531151 [Trichonephila clavata]|uniref:Uncharacterized protein n=1 Tax=Trichonephila clavata TaxID=2740835 RepID=A0A8X6IC00_TRICU|nr:hypothetical protein TNCT_531151 [Trichonephila clavata]